MGALNDGRSRKRGPRPDVAERNRLSAKHGMTGSREFRSWESMKARILSPSCPDFPDYGGRGLDLDPRWIDFHTFYLDLGSRPPNTTLGRIDNDRGYWPDNCRWETSAQQNRNRRSSRPVTAFGETKTVAEWAESIGCSRQALRYRLRVGWSIEDALLTPFNHANRRP